MVKKKATYSVKQLSQLAGVSVRTLHHYDKVGLLKPAHRGESRYRYYEKEQLYRLQQILFYKELDYPLQEIAEILDNPSFDLIRSLNHHKQELLKRANRMEQLLDTIDKTIISLKNEEGMITDEEIYAGFPKEEVPKIKEEVTNRWGAEKLEATENTIRNMGKTQWAEVQQEGDEISRWLANLMHKSPGAVEVQKVVKEHYRYMNQFHAFGFPGYRALGNMYVQDERFTAYYDKFKEGLAVFLNEAIQVFCDNSLEVADEK